MVFLKKNKKCCFPSKILFTYPHPSPFSQTESTSQEYLPLKKIHHQLWTKKKHSNHIGSSRWFDGRNPANQLGCTDAQNPVNNEISTFQLEQDFFHQQYHPKWWWKMVIYHGIQSVKITKETNLFACRLQPIYWPFTNFLGHPGSCFVTLQFGSPGSPSIWRRRNTSPTNCWCNSRRWYQPQQGEKMP